MEQGQLVDDWSSLELKHLLYITERRIRYGSSGALRSSALYFKSGSLYSCEEEEGFTCKKYHGNKRNHMNSVAIVETPAGQDRLYYMVVVISNVLWKNSAVDHRNLARAIHQRLLQDHPEKPLAEGELPPAASDGKGLSVTPRGRPRNASKSMCKRRCWCWGSKSVISTALSVLRPEPRSANFRSRRA